LRAVDRPLTPLALLCPGCLFLPALAFTLPLRFLESQSGFASRLLVNAGRSFFPFCTPLVRLITCLIADQVCGQVGMFGELSM
jgi:hypothetical protein